MIRYIVIAIIVVLLVGAWGGRGSLKRFWDAGIVRIRGAASRPLAWWRSLRSRGDP